MNQPVRFRFGGFEFNSETGELVATSAGAEIKTLSPQPARLLQMLLEKNGELLTRDEIRQTLWPETHIDFDASLHFCIRQIRSALGDDANSGGSIETLPRRGYRLSVPVKTIVDPAILAEDTGSAAHQDSPPKRGSTETRRRSGDIQLLLWALSVPVGLLGAGLLAILVTRGRLEQLEKADGPRSATATVERAARTGPLRLAVLPFEVGVEDTTIATRSARLSEGLTAALTRRFNDPEAHTRDRVVRVLGPLSTAPYRELPFPKLDQLRADLGIDLVLNARIVEGGDTSPGVQGILVELIDTDTRAHLWADFYPLSTDWLLIDAAIVDGVEGAVETWSEPQ